MGAPRPTSWSRSATTSADTSGTDVVLTPTSCTGRHGYVGAMSRITTPFGWASTATEVLDGVDLHGRRFLVTGAASGLGIETTRALAHAGAHVTMGVRDLMLGQRVASEISLATRSTVDVMTLDLTSLQSIE